MNILTVGNAQPNLNHVHHQQHKYITMFKAPWVVSVQGKGYDVLDSLYKNQLSPSLQIKLTCIYGCGIKDIGCVVPCVQQQELGTVDCGVLTIWKYNLSCGTLTWLTVENI